MEQKPWLKHVAEGNPKEVNIPIQSLQQLLKQSVEKYRENIAITFYNKTYTYGQLHTAIEKVASSFVKLGIKKGDRVAIMLPNCPQYPISYYAALQCGATVVQVNPMYKAEELNHILKDSGASSIIVYDQLLPLVTSIKEQTQVREVIDVSFDQPCRFNTLIQDEGDQSPVVEINPKEDIAVLQYTGGTTGRSKGAMLTHYNIVANTMQSAATSKIKTKVGEERVLTISPLFHVYGMTSGMNLTFYNGGNLILLPKFEIEQVLETIERLKPTGFPGVPTMYIALLNYAKERQVDLSCLSSCISGSAPLPLNVLHEFKEATGAPIAEGYGLSEASPVTHRNPVAGLQKPGSIGIPIPNTDAKIVDRETGKQDLAIGEVGELVIKGPQIMKGYWQLPEETNNTLRDGWLYTGDLAKMDEDGFFYIVGRKKEMIIASGFNVYPIEIEEVLYAHPQVLEAAVFGVPDPYRGETIQASIVLKEGESLSEEEITAYCRKRLAAYKVPKVIQFLPELPKSAVGKILKRKLQEQVLKAQ
ncbi:long-chain-fatty-acid--CoA ligase [Desertibacillus haloalkaliphilus]|uniref:long-chain-fatty-acid--CoA ligase n=1 Tax=Desertibacillus haloalkaliphilus TaxID=1328930 RepID=UPI001C257237|nr:long-chain fatty acid--CoA ligase [Desertibacillus haloalkaliphilus]MBU8905652.1 long-chain fatty acid--CoA ligase [Desertibacillus haloalkaliphilus]